MSRNSGPSFFEQFLDDYYAECDEHLSSARTQLLSIDASEAPQRISDSTLDELLRNFHSLKGLSAMVGVDEVTQLSHHIEDFLRELKEPNALVSGEGIQRVLDGISTIEQVLAARRKSEAAPEINEVVHQLESASLEIRSTAAPTESGVPVRNWRFEFKPSAELAAAGVTVGSIRESLRSLGQIVKASPRVLDDGGVAFEFIVATSAGESAFQDLVSKGVQYAPEASMPAAASVDQSPESQPSKPPSVGMGSLNFVRVEMSRLDELMRLVGEMVISRFRLDEILRSGAPSQNVQAWRTLGEINLSMERQVRELREAVMRVRMVPIGQIFERMRFVVRGLERETNKRIEVQIRGQETEIDKIIVETMMDPLLHLVRNAVSHGLEPAAERLASGKTATGLLQLCASAAGDSVLIEVQDDGRGLNTEKIAARARSLGLLDPKEDLDSRRVLDVICMPGFTTRDEADFASGRGVGMAAVRAAVDEMGGTITMETKPGRGTRFAIRLPLTLLIADSLLVTVGQQRFAVPQSAVREVFSIESKAVKSLENSEIVPFREGILPILRLRRLFGLEGDEPDRMHLMVVGEGETPMGLAVDRITGQREIVVRAARDPFLKTPGVVGATELGDGRPILILDPHSLIRAVRDERTQL